MQLLKMHICRALFLMSLVALSACGEDALVCDDGGYDASSTFPLDCPAHPDLSFSWYFQVCGANGVTYGTWEEATCAGVAYRPGSCDPAACAAGEPGPAVCGTDGKTYAGDQTAGCYGALRASTGPCAHDGG